MANMAYTSNGVPIEYNRNDSSSRETSISASSANRLLIPGVPLVTATAERRECCGRTSSNQQMGDPSNNQILLIRIAGIMCVVFGASEIGVGYKLFTTFTDYQAGAWWSVLMVVLAGILGAFSNTRRRVSLVVILGTLGTISSLIGLFSDSGASTQIRMITTCGSRTDANSPPLYYGRNSQSDQTAVNVCIATAQTTGFYYNTCYCSAYSGTVCGQFQLSDSSLKMGRNCGYIFTEYISTLVTSVSLITVALCSVLFLAIMACSGICCPGEKLVSRRLQMTRAEAIEITPAFGVSQATIDSEYRDGHLADNSILRANQV